MKEFFKECVQEAFTDENLDTLWTHRKSKQDIIALDTSLPIRYKLNTAGTRNIELMLQCQFGFYYKTIALVENTHILFPREFDSLVRGIDFKGFTSYGLKAEINVMIGAFSMETLTHATKGHDVDSYTSNGGKLELVRAFDGTMQTFVKTNSVAISDFDITGGHYRSELDGGAVSSFNFTNGNSKVHPTHHSHEWLDRLTPQRLLEVFTIER